MCFIKRCNISVQREHWLYSSPTEYLLSSSPFLFVYLLSIPSILCLLMVIIYKYKV
ncbi:hypothetical protein BDB01DRAFT_772865 [Pilobolus umbonatus]|nr:hypothetical protein BDB01DRAFT_772865 [Pilobolus umbonatus]